MIVDAKLISVRRQRKPKCWEASSSYHHLSRKHKGLGYQILYEISLSISFNLYTNEMVSPSLTSWRLELYAARKVAFARSPHSAMAHGCRCPAKRGTWIDLRWTPQNRFTIWHRCCEGHQIYMSHISDYSVYRIKDWSDVIPVLTVCRTMSKSLATNYTAYTSFAVWQCACIKHHQNHHQSTYFYHVHDASSLARMAQSSRTSNGRAACTAGPKTLKRLDGYRWV